MKTLIAFLALCAVALGATVFEFEQALEQAPKNDGKHWVLIAAGSNGYYNYRHQVL